MQLIILGDNQRVARSWIPFARQKLRQLKLFKPEPILINESFTPVSNVFVHLKSVNNIDTIRIRSCAGNKCRFGTPEAPGTVISQWDLSCPEAGEDKKTVHLKATDYYPWDAITGYGGRWWYGDPKTSNRPDNEETARVYDYGKYFPSLTTWTAGLPVDGESQMFGKEAAGLTSSDAYNAWNAKAWATPFGGFLGPTFIVRHTGNSLPYTYTGTYLTVNFNLTGTEYTLMPDATAFLYYTVFEQNASIPVGLSVEADGGSSVVSGNTDVIIDLTGSIGSAISVTTRVNGGYAELPTPPNFKAIGVSSAASGVPQNIYRTRKTILLKRDGTIKQIGDSVHTKETNILDTFTG